VLHVRSGDCSTGEEVVCNDDDNAFNIASGTQSTAQFATEVGTRYYLFVDGYGGASRGEYVLATSIGGCADAPPPECFEDDDCADGFCDAGACAPCVIDAHCMAPEVCQENECGLPREDVDAFGTCADPVAVGAGRYAGSTAGAPSNDSGSCAGNGNESIFTFTPAVDTDVCLNTFDSNYDTVLYVRADACDGAEVDCNDDAEGTRSQVGFAATAGTTYFIYVDGFFGSGEFVLDVSLAACPL
jgi:hypothetical protein